MGNKKNSRKISARRAATFLAALGALVMSSGVALMVTATSADAAPATKVVVCKYVGIPGGTLDHIVVVDDNSMPAGFTGDFPYSWTDAHGQTGQGSIAIRYADEGPPPELAKDISLSECPTNEEQPTLTTAVVTFTDPTCDTAADFSATSPNDGVDFGITGTPGPGNEMSITATAKQGFELSGDASWSHTFTVPTGCSQVSPPLPPKKHHASTQSPTTVVSTPTVVHAGLAGATTDMRGEQGLALTFAGMLMLMAAGGLGLRLRGGASRI